MKKFILLILTVFMTVSLFAQDAKSTGLTDKEVQNFAKYLNSISEDMENAFGYDENPDYLSEKADYLKAQKILAKYGFTGSNVVEKYAMLGRCIGVLSIEKSGAMELFKAMGMNPMAAQMAYISQKDYDVVERNWDAIAKALDYEGMMEETEQEDDDYEYQSQMDDFMSSLMGMLSSSSSAAPKKTDNKAIRATFDSEVKAYRDYLNKFDASSKKDIGFIYKKYDKANASKYKLESKNGSNYMADETGYTFKSFSPKLEGTQAEVYFKMNTVGAAVYYTMDKDDASEYIESTKTEVDKWDIYSCGSGREIVYYLTDGRIVHVWMEGNDNGKAILETDSIKLEGVYSYSPF